MLQRLPPEPSGEKVPGTPTLKARSTESDDGVRFLFPDDQSALIRRIGLADVPVLILGETGSGKEVLARHIHRRSIRRSGQFVKVNCASMPVELMESELFGYRRGAFTGAFQDKPGRFEQADGGTLFLDEIGEIPPPMQAKLLQVLQDQEFDPLGGRGKVRVDVRVITATNQELESQIEKGLFRADLYYRLNVITIRVPPLRERRSLILPLCRHLLQRYGYPELADLITGELRQALIDYPWPGNVRELENMVRRLAVLQDAAGLLAELRSKPAEEQDGARRQSESLPEPAPVPPISKMREFEHTIEDTQRALILRTLQATHWNRRRAAVLLGVEYKSLLYRMRKLNIGGE